MYSNPNPFARLPEQTGSPPVWVPLSRAAEACGMRVDLFRSAVEAGQIPIRVEAFGKRGVFMASQIDLQAYVAQQHQQRARHPLELAR